MAKNWVQILPKTKKRSFGGKNREKEYLIYLGRNAYQGEGALDTKTTGDNVLMSSSREGEREDRQKV